MRTVAICRVAAIAAVATLIAAGSGCAPEPTSTGTIGSGGYNPGGGGSTAGMRLAISPATATVLVSDSARLVARFYRDDKVDSSVAIIWSTRNENVATVSALGTVLALAEGETSVLVSAQGVKDSAKISINRRPVASVTVQPASGAIDTGATVQLTAITKDNAGRTLTGRAVTWSSSDASIASITATGAVHGVRSGSVAITATSEGKSGAASVSVVSSAPAVASVSIQPASATVETGKTVQLGAMLTDANGSVLFGRAIVWSSSNTAIATVSTGGLVTGMSPGDAVITATSEGKTGSSTVTVNAPPAPVASVVVSPASTSVTTGGTAQFVATAKDANGTVLAGKTPTWSSSNVSVATVSSSGLALAIAVGTTSMTATVDGKSGSATMTVVPVPVASITLTPSSPTLSAGQSVQLQATLRDAANNVLTGRTITWTSSNTAVATVSASGLVSGAGAGGATITATSEGKSATASVTVTAIAPPPSGTVDLKLTRLAAGTGVVMVSSGVPLQPGRLRAADLGMVQVLVAGQEPAAVYVEALAGTHPDGSVRSILVQFNYDVPITPLSAQLVFGRARSAGALAKPSVDRGNPAAVLLPVDPQYLIGTDIVGPTVPASTSAGISAVFQKYESDFRKFADYHWNLGGPIADEDYYDRALIYFAWWVRTGEFEFWRRGSATALSYRRDYLEYYGYAIQPHYSQLEGLEKHYLLTGDEASRYAIARVAERLQGGFQPTLGHTDSWWENRIQARLLQSYLLAWRLQATGSTSLNWAALLDDALPKILSTQTADGSYRFVSLCGESLNYMTGLLNDVFIKYYAYYKPDPRIPPAVRRAVDFLWSTQWLPGSQAFKYLSGPCAGVGDATPSVDLNNLMVTGFGWTYQQTGDAAYRDRGDQIFAGGVNGAYLTGTKQFNEEYTASFRYLKMRQ